jgi:hypothetical protein
MVGSVAAVDDVLLLELNDALDDMPSGQFRFVPNATTAETIVRVLLSTNLRIGKKQNTV